MIDDVIQFPGMEYIKASTAQALLDMNRSYFYKALKTGEIPHGHFVSGIRVNLTKLKEKMETPGSLPELCERCVPDHPVFTGGKVFGLENIADGS